MPDNEQQTLLHSFMPTDLTFNVSCGTERYTKMLPAHLKTFEEVDAYCRNICFNNITRNFTICTEERYADCRMYPKWILDIEYLVPVSVLLLCVFLAGLVANLCVCAVIVKHPLMRTEANIYLFSLAFSDLLLLVSGLPIELWDYWNRYPYIFGDFVCRTTKFLASTGTWASALTIVAFSFERYEAICHPINARARGSRVWKVMAAIWIASVATALPVPYLFSVGVLYQYPGTGEWSEYSLVCSPDADCKICFYIISFGSVVFFLMPMVVLTLIYLKIALFLRSSSKLSRRCGIHNSSSENKRTFYILIAVVLSFFASGAPFHYQRVTAPFLGQNQSYAEKVFDRKVLVVTGVFYYLSATINPLLYNVMSKRYRKAFKEIIWKETETKSRDDISPLNSTKTTGVSIKKSSISNT